MLPRFCALTKAREAAKARVDSEKRMVTRVVENPLSQKSDCRD